MAGPHEASGTNAPEGATRQRCLAALGRHPGGELHVGGIGVRELARRFGTPFYAFDGDLVDRRVDAVRHALGPRVELLWSAKANPSLALTARLRARGVGIEIASLGELALALAAGHDAAAIRFAGPGKSDDEIAAALAAGLGCFHAESASEVDAIAAAARAAGVRAGVAVRVNAPVEGAGARLRMAGRSSRFGVDREQVPALLRRIEGDGALRLCGLHVYAGTQNFDAAAFVAGARDLALAAREWERDLGLPLDEIDLGGGFGAPTFAGDPEFDLDSAGAALRALVDEHAREGRRWFVELGRYLVGPAGVYVSRVVRRKVSGGQVQLALDGGLHHCAVATGFGTVLRRSPLLVAAAALGREATEPATIGGPLCTPQDQFAAQLALPPLAEGDLVAVLGVGAYGLTFSPAAFLSHATPPEVLVEGGAARIVRERGVPEDALRGQWR